MRPFRLAWLALAVPLAAASPAAAQMIQVSPEAVVPPSPEVRVAPIPDPRQLAADVAQCERDARATPPRTDSEACRAAARAAQTMDVDTLSSVLRDLAAGKPLPASFSRPAPARGTRGWLLPVRSEAEAEAFWGGSERVLGSAALAVWDDGTGLSTTLYEGVFSVLSFNFSAMLDRSDRAPSGDEAAQADVDRSAAAERFLQGGGNASFSITFPLGYASRGGRSFFSLLTYARVGADLPALGTAVEDPSFAYDVGARVHGKAITTNEKVGLMFEVRVGAAGGSGPFRALIGRTSSRPFGIVHLSGGVLLSNTVLVGIAATPGAPADVRRALPDTTLITSLMFD